MDWKDIGTTVAKTLPFIGGALGGPAGTAIGSLISNALGVKDTPDDVSAALANNPEALEKIKELELNTKVQLQQLILSGETQRLNAETESYKAEVSDRQSARDLAAKQQNDKIRPVITVIILMGYLLTIVLVFSGVAEPLLKDPTASVTIGMAIGAIFSECKQVLSFWFGSTRYAHDEEKNNFISQMNKVDHK